MRDSDRYGLGLRRGQRCPDKISGGRRSSNATAPPHKPTIPIAQRRARLGPVRSGARPDARIIVTAPWTDLARHRRIGCWARRSTQFVRAGQGVQRHEAAPSGASRWCLGIAPLRRPRTVVQSGKLQRVYTRLPRAGCRCAVQTMPTLPIAPRLRGEHPGGARQHVSKLPVPTWSTSRSDRGFNVLLRTLALKRPTLSRFASGAGSVTFSRSTL
jgi:hypothetical protein